MRRATVIAGILVATAGVAAWWTYGGSTSDVPTATEGEDPTTPEAAPADAASLAGRARSAPAPTGRTVTAALGGVVRRAGRPVAARVEAYAVGQASMHEPLGWHDPGAGIRCMDPVPEVLPTATVLSAEDGRYRFDVLPRGLYRIVASTSDGARGTERVEVPGDGATLAQDLHVVLGPHAIRGHVRDALGKPWRGSVRAVLAWWDRTDEGPWPGDAPSVETREDGAYELSGLDAGRYVVRAEIPGAVRFVGPETWVPRADPYDLVVGAGMHPLDGRVLSDGDGAPIAGAIVTTSVDKTWTRAVTDDAGRFRLLAGPDQTYYVARAAGFSLAANFAPPGLPELVVQMTRTGRVVGRVLSEEDGRPVPGVTLLAARRLGGSAADTGHAAVSDAEGRYALEDVDASVNLLTTRGGGFVMASAGGARGPIAAIWVGRTTTVELDVVVARGDALKGRVLDPEGTPVAGARVVVTPTPLSGSDGVFTPPIDAGLSDAEGRFEVAGLNPTGSHDLAASATGFLPVHQALAVGAASAGPVEVRLARPARLDVRVVGESGEALPHAEVYVLPTAGVACRGVPGPDGWTHLPAVDPSAPLVVWAPGCVASQHEVPPPDAQGQCPPVTVTLFTARTIAGRVTYADGRPAEGADVRAESAGSSASAKAEADGSFVLENLTHGDVVVSASSGQPLAPDEQGTGVDGEVHVTASAGDKDVRVVLLRKSPPPAPTAAKAVVVRVVDPAGLPVGQANVRYEHSSGNGTVNLQAGRAEVPRGFTSLYVSLAGSTAGTRLPVGPAAHGPVAADVDEVEVRLPPETRVAGLVTDEAGRPVGNVWVAAIGETEPDDACRANTDAEGRFRIGSLGSGPHRIRVFPPPDFVEPAGVKAAEGETGVRIQLVRAVRALVTVLDEAGASVVGATVRVNARGAGEAESFGGAAFAQATTDASGHALIEGLSRDGAYALQVLAPATRRDLLEWRLLEFPPADRTVRMSRARSIRGFVRDPLGAPVSGVMVRAHSAQGAFAAQADSTADGSFELTGLPAGRFELAAQLTGEGAAALAAPSSEPVSALADAHDVEIRLDPGLAVLVRVEGDWPKGTPLVVRLFDLREKGPTEDGPFSVLPDLPESAAETAVGADGVARFLHAPRDGRYAAAVGPAADGGCALLPDVRAGSAEVPVRLVRGQPLRVRLHGAELADGTVAADRSGATWYAKSQGGGTYLFPALPPGRYRIAAFGWTGDAKGEEGAFTLWSATTEASAGETVEVELTPQK